MLNKSTKIYTFEENNPMNRKLTVFALVLLAITIGLGAFGAHGLKGTISEKGLVAYETAVKYQFYGSLLLLILSFQPAFNTKTLRNALNFFLIGLLLFSGSIFGLVLGQLLNCNCGFLGPITPIGGLIMILSVLFMAWGYATNKS